MKANDRGQREAAGEEAAGEEPAGDRGSGEISVAPGDASQSSGDGGPGCMPAVLAATVLMGIVGFVTCGLTTWMLYGKRTELAIRTLEETYLPAVEQSLLGPDEKQAVTAQLRELTMEMKRGSLENWQAGAAMQRLVRCPIIQWGELAAVERWLQRAEPERLAAGGIDDVEVARRHLSRLRRAVELDRATAIDVDDVLEPVVLSDRSQLERSLIDASPLWADIGERDGGPDGQAGIRDISERVGDVVARARTVAGRAEVPDRRFDDVRIERIVRRQIDAALAEGGF